MRPQAFVLAGTLLTAGLLVRIVISQERALKQGSPLDPDRNIMTILGAKTPNEATAGYKSLLTHIDSDRLRQLQFHDNEQIAVQAAWQEVESTIPEKPVRVERPDRDKLTWFLGFLEGRARLRAPLWWAEAVIDARANRRGNIYPGGLNVREHINRNPDAATDARAAVLTKQDGKHIVRVGMDSVLLPDELFDRLRFVRPSDQIRVLITPLRCYIASHDDVGYAYKVACVDRSSTKILWIGDAWGSWWNDASGQHHQWIEVTEQGDRVVVFGIASTGFHVEAFRRQDGVNVFRFSNSYSPW